MIWRDWDLECANTHMQRLRWKRAAARWFRGLR